MRFPAKPETFLFILLLNMKLQFLIPCFLLVIFQSGCEEKAEPGILTLVSARVGNTYLLEGSVTNDVPTSQAVVLAFSTSVARESASGAISLRRNNDPVPLTISFADNDRTITVQPDVVLDDNAEYELVITDGLRGSAGQTFAGRSYTLKTAKGELKVLKWTFGETIPDSAPIQNVPLNLDLRIHFSAPLDMSSVNETTVLLTGPTSPQLQLEVAVDGTQLNISTDGALLDLAEYRISINNIRGKEEQSFTGFAVDFYTAADPEPDFPLLPDQDLLTLVQQQTFKYFWDFAHPHSGMARERNTSGDVVTSGGSGFGIMALIVGIERAFITRSEGLERMDKILTFLETADRFHGAWPHWMNGNTGDVVPFSPNDNGGDLVETSFLMQGLLTFRQYLDNTIPAELALIERVNVLWNGVEWNWYTQGGQNVLYWHWSPDKQWIMNHAIRGYNEALITYFLAAASPTYPVEASVYHEGWAANGAIRNGKSFYGITLPLGYDYGGPLFFSHYSFLGLDPRNLQDTYADYWTQNVNHTRINHAYAVDNPKNYVGYSDGNWGFTASDNRAGYAAHSPTNDLGVITPTAALSSFPYTPEESMKALRFFYYTLGDRLWGPFGFYDAFNLTEGWTADSYLAIDQGPIVVMIENYRTALLWDLFMSAPEVAVAMDKLSFSR